MNENEDLFDAKNNYHIYVSMNFIIDTMLEKSIESDNEHIHNNMDFINLVYV